MRTMHLDFFSTLKTFDRTYKNILSVISQTSFYIYMFNDFASLRHYFLR